MRFRVFKLCLSKNLDCFGFGSVVTNLGCFWAAFRCFLTVFGSPQSGIGILLFRVDLVPDCGASGLTTSSRSGLDRSFPAHWH